MVVLQAHEAIDAYYNNLRRAEIKNAWDHWDRLYADVITSKKLLENFRVVYGAYSPHREEEAFVVCPWKPGPYGLCQNGKASLAISAPKSHDPTPIGGYFMSKIISRPPALQVTRTSLHTKSAPPKFSSTGPPCNRDSPSPVQRPMSSLIERKT